MRARTRWVGPIAIRERVELRDRAEARLRLGLSDEANVVLVSAGGGGDPIAEAQLLESIEALRGRGLELVIAPGPLNCAAEPGREPTGPLCRYGDDRRAKSPKDLARS